MNAVEIEEAVSELASEAFDRAEFAYLFLAAFGNKETTLKRLRSGQSNASDVERGVLQRNNIHIAICDEGKVGDTLASLRDSPKTTAAKSKFILATDGVTLEAEDLASGEHITSEYPKFAEHFGFFLPLAGITTVKEIINNPIDVKATGRLNKLYVELLKDNPDWAKADRRPDMNHFMARLIFCFFAEDTEIFSGSDLFTLTLAKMSEGDGSNTHEVIEMLFRAMNTPTKHEGKPDDRYRKAAKTPNWADEFPYVNGGLFSGPTDTPKFSRIARSYLLRAGELDWKSISPDIFGSMIQAVADDEERGALGMHYTSVPNILKVLNPLFLDDLREKLEEAENSPQKLLNLRKRMAKIRVFDPACGSGNFLVIAYKEMRAIEAEINQRRGETDRTTDIPLTNFRGIELRDFPAEIARLSLIIAEYQSDVRYRGQKEALAEFLPLDAQNWITCGNALRLDWLSICPPTGSAVKFASNDLFETPHDQAQIDFENEGGETYICGNPPYAGKGKKTRAQIEDMEHVFGPSGIKHGYVDYVGCWFLKAISYGSHTKSACAFVSTNSVCQGHQVPLLWPAVFASKHQIFFAHTSFKWANLAANNAGVTVVIIGLANIQPSMCRLFSLSETGETLSKDVPYINAYLVGGPAVLVEKRSKSLAGLPSMDLGNMPYDGGNLLMTKDELSQISLALEMRARLTRRIFGSKEYINGLQRHCLWISDDDRLYAESIPEIRNRIDSVRTMRLASTDAGGRAMASRPHQLREMNFAQQHAIIMPRTSSESRFYLPAGVIDERSIVSSEAFAVLDAPLWILSLVVSRIHLTWIATVCGQLETRYRYSNTLGWNTFPIPKLTDQNKTDLTRCAENILLAREHYFPATIAEMYDPDRMDEEFPLVRRAHEQNDELLERIYIGRRFKNDTERLEKLFDLYTKMTAAEPKTKKKKAKSAA